MQITIYNIIDLKNDSDEITKHKKLETAFQKICLHR